MQTLLFLSIQKSKKLHFLGPQAYTDNIYVSINIQTIVSFSRTYKYTLFISTTKEHILHNYLSTECKSASFYENLYWLADLNM